MLILPTGVPFSAGELSRNSPRRRQGIRRDPHTNEWVKRFPFYTIKIDENPFAFGSLRTGYIIIHDNLIPEESMSRRERRLMERCFGQGQQLDFFVYAPTSWCPCPGQIKFSINHLRGSNPNVSGLAYVEGTNDGKNGNRLSGTFYLDPSNRLLSAYIEEFTESVKRGRPARPNSTLYADIDPMAHPGLGIPTKHSKGTTTKTVYQGNQFRYKHVILTLQQIAQDARAALEETLHGNRRTS